MGKKICQLIQGVFCIPNSTNVGVIAAGDDRPDIYLIDSGPSEIEGEYALDVLKERFGSFTLKAIITTHGHPDHTGGHRFIKERTGCEIWISEKERAFMENPALHGSILWGSAPPRELRTLYFRPEAALSDRIISEKDIITLKDGRTLSFIELYGHSPQEIGIIIENMDGAKVLFAGDAVFPRLELGHHWISLITNPKLYMESLDKLSAIKGVSCCVPSHGDLIHEDFENVVELNKIAILSTRQCILNALLKKRMTLEELVKYVADYHELKMKISQYALITSTVKSYLSALQDEKKVVLQVEDNVLYYALKN